MPFRKGQSGNPGGRRSYVHREKLQAKFSKALLDDFEAEGVDAIRRLRLEDPYGYARVIVATLPKDPVEMHATVETRSLVEILTGLGESADIAMAAGRAGSVREGSVRLDS